VKKYFAYTLPRNALYGGAVALGILAGFLNIFLAVDFTVRPALVASLLASIIIVVSLHEGIHGGVAVLFGHKPLFGLKPPLVYITFTGKIPRNHFILVALAPLVVLDAFFVVLYVYSPFKLFSDFCLIINTIGALGDVWIVVKLLSVEKGAMIQDTKTGIEVWVADEP